MHRKTQLKILRNRLKYFFFIEIKRLIVYIGKEDGEQSFIDDFQRAGKKIKLKYIYKTIGRFVIIIYTNWKRR